MFRFTRCWREVRQNSTTFSRHLVLPDSNTKSTLPQAIAQLKNYTLIDFRTSFTPPPFAHKIQFSSKVLAMGSCFSTMIGAKLQDRKFTVMNNPFGTIFNPVSLFGLLHQSLLNQPPDPDLVLKHDDRYYHYGFHSDLSHVQKDQLLVNISDRSSTVRVFLAGASHLLITLGTAHVYELSASGQLVANCHKQPQLLFNKRLLTLEEMKTSFMDFYIAFREVNSLASVLLTLSPVRHIKDGLPENQLSKSLLRVLIHHLKEECDGVQYFPGYELMMDDLRDYRYYKEDMIHPTALAENYIWEMFQSSFLDKNTSEIMRQIEIVLNALQHKAFHPEGQAHQQFLQKLLEKMERLTLDFDFSKEIKEVKERLTQERLKPIDHDR